MSEKLDLTYFYFHSLSDNFEISSISFRNIYMLLTRFLYVNLRIVSKLFPYNKLYFYEAEMKSNY